MEDDAERVGESRSPFDPRLPECFDLALERRTGCCLFLLLLLIAFFTLSFSVPENE